MLTPTLKYQTIWLSDLHLGHRHCKASFLLDFLSRIQCQTLYLVGDVLDLWSMSNQWYWPAAHSDLLRKLLDLAVSGTTVIYVPGNHDELLREFCGNSFGSIHIRKQVEHTTLMGRRLLVTHGDEFEHGIRCGAFTKVLGNASYAALLRLNRIYNGLRAWRGQHYWSLAAFVKNRVGNARRAIESFEEVAMQYARLHGFDGVVCGHIHQPRIREEDGIVYYNDGDWVDNCTALVEDLNGSLRLIHWADLQFTTGPDAANEAAVSLRPRREVAAARRESPHVHG